MPQAIPAIVGMAVGYYLGATLTAFYIISALVSVGVSILMQTKADFGDRSGMAQGVLDNFASVSSPIPVIYGERKVGGPRALVESTGTDNEFLHMVIIWAEGEISDVTTVYLDDVASTDARFTGLVTITNYVGTDAQTADPGLVADVVAWTSNHRLRGIAYTVVKLQFNPTQFPGGVPVVTADIEGKLLYDPRTTTTGYSTNPALCIRDYLTNARYGLGIPTTELDDASFEDAADYCETTVSIPPSGTQSRYTSNGYLDTDKSPLENINSLLTACRGMITFTGGAYKLLIDKPETPVFTFDETNLIGSWTIQLDSKARRLNRMRVEFFNPVKNWKKDTAIVDSPTFRTADNGDMLESQTVLPFTSNRYTAEQIAGIELKQSRYQTTVEVTATIEALRTEVGDVVYLTHSVPGWTAKEFRVIGMALDSKDTISLKLLEYDVGVYTLDALAVEDTPPATNLPNPWDVAAPTSLVLSVAADGHSDGSTNSFITATWTAPADAFFDHYRVEWKKSTDTYYTGADIGGTDNNYVITGLKDAVSYNVRIKAINTVGASSPWLTGSKTTVADTTAPAVVTSVASAASLLGIEISWTNPTDADFAAVEIWKSSTSSHGAGASLAHVHGENYTDRMAAGLTRYYWVRSQDMTGNQSAWVPSDAGAGASATSVIIDNSSVDDYIDDDESIGEIVSTFDPSGTTVSTVSPTWTLLQAVSIAAGKGTVNVLYAARARLPSGTTKQITFKMEIGITSTNFGPYDIQTGGAWTAISVAIPEPASTTTLCKIYAYLDATGSVTLDDESLIAFVAIK